MTGSVRIETKMRFFGPFFLAITLVLSGSLLLLGCTGSPAMPVASPVDPGLQVQVSGTNPGAWSPLAPSVTPASRLNLLLWVPPQFNPASGTPAGLLLQARLDEFEARNPRISIETRVKAVSGPGGLLDSLTAASAAAPQALPDLVALPRDLMEAAALKGLLLPLDNLTKAVDDPDWYAYAASLARLQKNIYGLPFAGDALVQVYHPAVVAKPPDTFQAVLETGQPLAFPAAGDQPYLTLVLYSAGGGVVTDEQGRPYLSPSELTQVLTFYLSAEKAGVMPQALLTQLQNDDQSWEAFMGNQAGLTVTWSSRFLGTHAEDIALAPIPTPGGKPFTLATGWVWGVAGRDENKRKVTVELAEFLTDPHFLAAWTLAAGYMPTRPSSLEKGSISAVQKTIGKIALSAQLLPSNDVLSSLDNPLQQAIMAVLKGQTDPALAAKAAASSLTGP
jgi:multiple sugar transport system substrate-binding protein